MTRYRSLVCAVVMLAGSVALPGQAQGQSAQERAAAEQLFEKARQLIKDGLFERACPMLEESYKLDAATGTQLNLAHCYEMLGRLASAWGSYREVAAADEREGRRDRAKFAQGRAEALAPEIPRLIIRVPDEHAIPGLEVRRGGVVVSQAVYGVAVYVDQGVYRIEASAPGYGSHEQEVHALNGVAVEVEIPALERAPEAEAEGDGEAEVASPILDGVDTGAPPEGVARGRTRRVVGLSLGVAGLASLGAGVGFGLWARSTWNQAFDEGRCDRDTLACDSTGQAITDTARSRALVATVLAGAGLLATVGGTVLYLTAPDDAEARPRGVRVAPVYGQGEVGLALSGWF